MILLDEPTSGLDSFKALQIVKLLKNLSRKGKTVISTIHQPSSEAFNEFDRLILMSNGHIVYQGEAKLSAGYFRSIGFKLPEYSNPADTYMRILAVHYPPTDKDERKTDYFVKCYQDKIHPGVVNEMGQLKIDAPDMTSASRTQAGLCKQISLLNARGFKGV